MKVKTAELIRVALNWAVAQCLGLKTDIPSWAKTPWVRCFDESGVQYVCPEFSTDWSQGGPIIDKHDIDIFRDDDATQFGAHTGRMTKHPTRGTLTWNGQKGPTKLVAAMRCFVASKLGDEVDVPEELLT